MSNMADSERAISTEELLKNQHWVLIDGKVYDIEHFDTHPGDSGLAGPQVSRWNAHPAAEQCGPQTRAQPGLEGLRWCLHHAPLTILLDIDCVEQFDEIGHSPKSRDQLGEFCVGVHRRSEHPI